MIPRGPPGRTLLLCVCSGNALLGDLLWVITFVERDFLSVLSIYLSSFLSVLFVSSLIRDILLCLSILTICSCVLVVLV